jgi:Ion channel
MVIVKLHTSFGRMFRQRCFYLFVSLLALIILAPFLIDTLHGRLFLQMAQVLVLVAAVAAVGRTTIPFIIALLLGIPAFGFQVVSLLALDDALHYRVLSISFYLAFYLVAVAYLLRYVFSPEVMTDDKLFGAAAGYLMLGVLFTYAYFLVQHVNPRAFGGSAGDAPRSFYDLLYMSFGCLTSNGPGDVLPIGSKVRSLVILEQVCGALFVAILIARLAGIYPPKQDKGQR